jgi:hypothetical protein
MKNELKRISIVLGETKHTTENLVFAIRDFLKWVDPEIGLVWVTDDTAEELGTVAFAVNEDKYELSEFDNKA